MITTIAITLTFWLLFPEELGFAVGYLPFGRFLALPDFRCRLCGKVYVSLRCDLVLSLISCFVSWFNHMALTPGASPPSLRFPVLLQKDSLRRAVFLVPIHIRYIGGPNHILYDRPFRVDLAEQRDDPIVKRS